MIEPVSLAVAIVATAYALWAMTIAVAAFIHNRKPRRA
jgi:hypothetical protein